MVLQSQKLYKQIMSNESAKTMVEVNEVTGFSSSVDPVSAYKQGELSMSSELMEGMSDGASHDLVSFLKRPVLIRNGDWDTTQTTNTIITQVAIPEDIILGSLAMSQKIYGFMAFRAKAVIRLQVNCNRFQQGRLLLYFFPQDKVSTIKYRTTSGSLYYSTQLPRIDFDANTDTEVVLEVPYISPQLAYDTTTGTGHVGVVNLAVYSPLAAAAGELSAEYSIWCHFEDVQLMYPTISNTTYVPQSGKRVRKLRVGSSIEDEADSSTGAVSDALIRVSKAAGVLGEIPLLSSVAIPASWVAGVLARSAQALGFSNPLDPAKVMTVQQRTFAKAQNVDGPDNSVNMALTENNHLEHLPGFAGSDLDEMSFMHALTIPAYVFSATWLDTALPLNTIYTTNVGPNYFRFAGTVGLDTIPLSYIANLFSFYRGSIRFKFKFVKTEFHSGRLAFVFTPGWLNLASPTLTNNNINYVHKDVVDIRGITEHEFVCPWVNTWPMLPVGQSYGTLQVCVVNDLRRPDTVTSSIQMIVEVSCASDFQFYQPNNNCYVPFLYNSSGTPQAGDPQIGQVDHPDQAQVDEHAIGQSSLHPSNNLVAAKYCSGEMLTSFRQLIKRSVQYVVFSLTGVQDTAYLLANSNMILLYNTTTVSWESSPASNRVFPDLVAATINCFAYTRGSYRFKIYNGNGNGTNAPLTSVSMLCNAPFATTTIAVTSAGSQASFTELYPPVVPVVNAAYPNPEISVPHYSQYSQLPTTIDRGGLAPYTAFKSKNWLVMRWNGLGTARVMRQCGDDFSAGLWVGSCPIINPTTVNNTDSTPTW